MSDEKIGGLNHDQEHEVRTVVFSTKIESVGRGTRWSSIMGEFCFTCRLPVGEMWEKRTPERPDEYEMLQLDSI